jgi:gamma-glutamyl hercynylcysteine S-oxide synthase
MLATRHHGRPADRVADDLASVRARTLALVSHLEPAQLERSADPIMSPLVWDLAHIAAYEDLWLCHRHGGVPLLHGELAEMYDAFETPRNVRGELPLLDAGGATVYLADVRERTVAVLAQRGAGDGTLIEMVLRHELQHTETMRQAMALGDLLPPGEPPPGPTGATGDVELVPAGPFVMGAGPDGFAYDNERPRHPREVPGFRIARWPVTNAMWLDFSEGGGYRRRAWWSDEGWAWKQASDAGDRSTARDGRPEAPVCHVSWYEADAFARSVDARLPDEAEWEKASRCGALEAVGHVWEWTASAFAAYPGFVAHPYREYSEVFFGDGYRVLRGASWASDLRVVTPTFRNWDLPRRRQLFAGLRLALDAERG